MEARGAETQQETVARLRLEIAELRASRERLVRAADSDRRRLERALHDGVQQHLIGLAVDVQLACTMLDTDPGEARTLLGQMGRDVQHALDDAVRLAQRIYSPLLDAGGLAAALRAAATSAGIPASINVDVTASLPIEIVAGVYLSCLAALESAGAGATVTVCDDDDAVSFTVEAAGDWPDTDLERLRDRVEALGGWLSIEPDGGARLRGSLPTAG